MRVYVPAVLSELSVLLPPVRVGVVAVPDAAMSGEDVEVLEDDAITEAALSSLELARETDGALPARVVLAVDTPKSTTLTPGDEVEPHIFTAPSFEYTWSDVAAILVDLPDAASAVSAVLEADTQEGADEAEGLRKQLEEAKANPDISEVEVMIRTGRIRETLKDEMLDVVKPDLVLCGARGLSSIKYALLGSISTFLLRNTDCDILVVK